MLCRANEIFHFAHYTVPACFLKHEFFAIDFIAATGKALQLTGTSVVRVVEGRFVEAWQNWDAAGLAAQLSDQPPAQLY